MSPKDVQEIEVEILEIDGSPAERHPQADSHARQTPQWQPWAAKARRLPAFWWPLWLMLGIIAVALLLTFGLVFILVYASFRILRQLARNILR